MLVELFFLLVKRPVFAVQYCIRQSIVKSTSEGMGSEVAIASFNERGLESLLCCLLGCFMIAMYKVIVGHAAGSLCWEVGDLVSSEQRDDLRTSRQEPKECFWQAPKSTPKQFIQFLLDLHDSLSYIRRWDTKRTPARY